MVLVLLVKSAQIRLDFSNSPAIGASLLDAVEEGCRGFAWHQAKLVMLSISQHKRVPQILKIC